MNKSKPDSSDEQIKALFESSSSVPVKAIEKQRQITINRARASVAQRDTMLLAFIKMWTVLADLLAPLFAILVVNKNLVSKPTKINKKSKNSQ